MASLSFAHLVSLSRWHLSWPCYPSCKLVHFQDVRLTKQLVISAVSSGNSGEFSSGAEEGFVKDSSKPPSKRGRKKAVPKVPDKDAEISLINNDAMEESNAVPRRSRRKGASASPEEGIVELKKRGRKPKKKVSEGESNVETLVSESELSDSEARLDDVNTGEGEGELTVELDETDDLSLLNGWPPLVCCFGAAQHAFVPSGRPANRLLNYEIHEGMKEAYWAPEKFVRAPGGCAGSVAVSLASMGGKVAFMGKLGDDDFGQAMLYYLNVSKVQTRSVRLDSKRVTAVSHMKIGKRGPLRMTPAKTSAEDSLSKSEINIDVLKEAKMFYFNTSSLLEKNMRSTTFQAVRLSKKLGGVIFYDLNLPLPLWESVEETKSLIQGAWDLADIIEVTKQELEFLCGIKPVERFDTKDNDRSKFVHYEKEVVSQLWHDNLKVLFVTNGTSKIHYYTSDHEGSVHGMEDPPLTPFTADMSASGDGIVAGLMRMLTAQPHLITDKGYLEHSIKYAIDCGVIEQWLLARARGFPPREDMEEDVLPDADGIRSITEREYRTKPDAEELEVPSRKSLTDESHELELVS